MSERAETRRTRGVLGGRSERVVQQVLVATVAELAESGYRAFRINVASATAGVNKTTIYRRWPGKKQLVAAAIEWMRRFVHDVPLPDTGSLEGDLTEAFRRKVSFKDRVEGRAWARLLAEKHDPEVSAVIGDAVKERSGAWYAMVTRAVARGELPDGTDPRLLLRMLGAVVDAWNASSPGGLKPELLDAAVRTVVAGARSGALVRSSGRRETVRALPRKSPDVPGRHRSSRLSRNTVPISDFEAQAADWLKRAADTGQPVVITQNGKAAGVLVSPSEYDRLCERARPLDVGLADPGT